jgi:hypothetical protein
VYHQLLEVKMNQEQVANFFVAAAGRDRWKAADLAADVLPLAVSDLVQEQTVPGEGRVAESAQRVAFLAAAAAEDTYDNQPLRWLGSAIGGIPGAVMYAIAAAEGYKLESSPYMVGEIEAAFMGLERAVPGFLTKEKLEVWAAATTPTKTKEV